MGFVSFNDERNSICVPRFAPGNVTAVRRSGILRRLMQLIRHFLRERTFGFVSMRLRASPAAGVSGCRAGVEYVVAMAKNAVLKRRPNEPCAKPQAFAAQR